MAWTRQSDQDDQEGVALKPDWTGENGVVWPCGLASRVAADRARRREVRLRYSIPLVTTNSDATVVPGTERLERGLRSGTPIVAARPKASIRKRDGTT
jgi:hypothetical protein